MNRIFVMFALAAIAMVACEKDNGATEKKEYVLTLASNSVLNFTHEGGSGAIGYNLTEVTRAHDNDSDLPVDEELTGDSTEEKPYSKDYLVEATCAADWITELTVAESITFEVLPNAGAEREALITVSYEEQSFSVLVRQAQETGGVDEVFHAAHLNGTYYGKLQTYGYNYFIILSDEGATEQNDSYGTQYRFDLYAGKSSALEPVDYVPVGVYVFGDCEPGTIDAANSYMLPGNGAKSVDFASAKVTVTENKIVAEVRLMSGKVHRVIYEGSLALDYLDLTAQDVTHSTQTADVNFDVTGGAIMAYYRGDYLGKDTDVWFLHMIENKAAFEGVYLMMDIMLDKSKGGLDNIDAIVGEYTVATYKTEDCAGHFAPGYMRDDWCMMHAWYAKCVNGGIDSGDRAPFVDGKITIAKDGSGYAITLDGVDDIGNKINGTFRGSVVEILDQAWDL